MPRKPRFPAGSVCKPCWELKYCPYGPLVELFPLPPFGSPRDTEASYKSALKALMAGGAKTEEGVWGEVERLFANRPWMEEQIREFPDEEVGCKIWGHVCPVFFVQSGATETKESRSEGRRVPQDVMLKVVRRDNHICQLCYQYVPDDQIEFDHIIPFSKGGPTTVENLRLLCRTCNRNKSNSLSELLMD